MNVGTKLINFAHNVDKGSNQSKKMRSAGYEPDNSFILFQIKDVVKLLRSLH